MWDSLLGIGFSLLLGLLGLAVVAWQIATFEVAASLDNLFLTIVGLLMAVTGLGYVYMVLQSRSSKGKGSKSAR